MATFLYKKDTTTINEYNFFMTAAQASKILRTSASTQKSRILGSFFKTGPGEYGEGDIFIGVTVPEIRKVAQNFQSLPLSETLKLLHSPIHEERLLAILIFIKKYEKGALPAKETIISLYLENTKYINNWDLVDLSAYKLLGDSLKDRPRMILDQLAQSISVWERRIAIVSTLAFIRAHKFHDTLRISEVLISDKEDLIHKASGWMLREVGKRDILTLEKFLSQRYKIMPRTMLRYAIERFPENIRKEYLKGTI